MIRVPFETMVYFYLFAGLLLVGACWLSDVRGRRRRERHARRFRLRCARCALEWDERGAEPLPKCPRCGTLNERTAVPTL